VARRRRDRRGQVAHVQHGTVPVLLGGGLRLLPDGVSTAWNLASAQRCHTQFRQAP
jgi:hypothetical protein